MVDAEALVVAWLTAMLNPDPPPGDDPGPVVAVSTETPAGFETRLPWVQVVRVGGGYDGFRLDRPQVDIDTYATDGVTAAALALRIQDVLHNNLARTKTGDAVVTRVDTITGPHWVPHENPRLRRYPATYRLTLHPAPQAA